MQDALLKDALQHALENIKGVNLSGTYDTALDVLNEFNNLYACVVSFAITPDAAIATVRDSNNGVVTPNQDGTYSLGEGAYTYGLVAEDYASENSIQLTISQADVTSGTKTVTKSMTRSKCVVTFDCTPEITNIVVNTDPVSSVVIPDQDGKYHLAAGGYSYTATAEGYTSQTDISLTISSGDVSTGTKTVTVTMVEV